MKCELIRDDLEVSPQSLADVPEHQENVEFREVVRNSELVRVAFWKRGAILDHPEAYYMVRQGVAIPADDACRVRARMSPEKFDAAKLAYERLLAHIKPEDRKLFDDGVISGYDEDGNFALGPNGHLLQQYLDAEKAKSEEEDDV